MKILIFLVIFLYGLAFGFLGSDSKERAIIGQNFPILLIIVFLLAGLAEWALVPPSKGSANKSKFKAVINNEVQYYSKCKKENGRNICEANSGKEVVVDDFWE